MPRQDRGGQTQVAQCASKKQRTSLEAEERVLEKVEGPNADEEVLAEDQKNVEGYQEENLQSASITSFVISQEECRIDGFKLKTSVSNSRKLR
jgi:hypothetical protein